MARKSNTQRKTGGRGPGDRFAPHLVTLEDRAVPATLYVDVRLPDSNPAEGSQVTFDAGFDTQQTLTYAKTVGFITATPAGSFAVGSLALALQAAEAIAGSDTIVIAQGVMIVTSLVAMRMAEKKGYWLVLLVSFIALPIRGVIAAWLLNRWGVYPVQILDGIGAGLQGVAVPGLVARVLDGTGRINAGQGAVMTVQGIGASLSPAIGGCIAQELGYGPMFLALGAFAAMSVALWIVFAPLLKAACAAEPEFDDTTPSAAGIS